MLYKKFHHIYLWFNHSFPCLALDSWLPVRVVLVSRHVHKIMTISFIMFVCPSVLYPFLWNSLPPTGWIFLKFDILVFFWKSVDTIQVSLQTDKNYGYFTGRPIYVRILSHSVLLRMRNVPDEILEKIKTQILSLNRQTNICTLLIFYLLKVI